MHALPPPHGPHRGGQHRHPAMPSALATLTDISLEDCLRGMGLARWRDVALEVYHDAHHPGRPGARPLRALQWTVTVQVVILAVALVALSAFTAGVAAGSPPEGTFTWDGLAFLGVRTQVSYAGGQVTGYALGYQLWALGYLLVAFVLGGRLWRLLPGWRDRPGTPRRAGSAGGTGGSPTSISRTCAEGSTII